MIPDSALCFAAAPLGISCRPQIVKAAKANDNAFAYSASSTAVTLSEKAALIADVKSERKVNRAAATGAVPYAANRET